MIRLWKKTTEAERRAKLRAKPVKDKKLVYSAYSRCDCGAGLAYDQRDVNSNGRGGAWDCSDILTGRAVRSGLPGSVTHSDRFPFAFWSIQSERSVRSRGATTRTTKEES